MFTFAICFRRSSVRNVREFVCPTQPVAIFGNFSSPFGIPWPFIDIHGKFYGDRPRETRPSLGLNARGVAKYSDFSSLECCISETVRDRR